MYFQHACPLLFPFYLLFCPLHCACQGRLSFITAECSRLLPLFILINIRIKAKTTYLSKYYRKLKQISIIASIAICACLILSKRSTTVRYVHIVFSFYTSFSIVSILRLDKTVRILQFWRRTFIGYCLCCDLLFVIFLMLSWKSLRSSILPL